MRTTPPPGSDRADDPNDRPNQALATESSGDAATELALRRLSILRPPRGPWADAGQATEGTADGAGDRRAADGDDDPGADHAIDDGLLVALRAGALDEDSEAALIERLLADPTARDLLMSLAEAPSADAFAEAEAVRPARATGLAPRSSLKRPGFDPGARRSAGLRFGMLAGLAAVALAAGLAIWVGRGVDRQVPPAHVLELTGGVAAARSADAESDTFVATSMLTLRIAPLAPVQAGAPTLLPSVFAGPPEGPLVAVPSDLLAAGEGGVWRLRAPAGRVLHGPSGPRVILVGLAPVPLDVAGQSAADAQAAHPEVRWHLQHLTWRAEAPSATEPPQ